jgi:hypothetical protein
MNALQKGDRGPAVQRWQQFLIGQGFDPRGVDGTFGKDTRDATLEFQKKHGLPEIGIVDNRTYGQALLLDMPVVAQPDDTSKSGPNWPPRPDFDPVMGTAARQAMFGKFAYQHDPQPGNYENIRITDDWEAKNIVLLEVPQLAGMPGAGSRGRARVHKLVAPQFLALWKAWEDGGLLPRVLSWAGAFNARFVRGSTSSLSNHAFGSAFDINVAWNPLGATPALVGEKGCVRELVRLANRHGFYWGGHFAKRPDGMHFEVAKLL